METVSDHNMAIIIIEYRSQIVKLTVPDSEPKFCPQKNDRH